MYEDYYRLDKRPFMTAPDQRFVFWSESHILAFTMLRYGVLTRAPLTLVTGEIGAGKTTLIRKLIDEMPQETVVGLVSNMQSGRGELLEWVMTALDQSVDGKSYVELFNAFQSFVVDAYASGRRVILIFDEAQNLSIESLEELRMLSNINSDGDDLLQMILVGQPQLRDLVGRPELVQFAQRVSSDFHLGALTAEEADSYIQHRLSVAGAKWRIFPKESSALIHQATRGVPRLVNVLCDLSLVYGFSAERKVVGPDLIREFLADASRRGIYQQFSRLDDSPKLVREAF